MRLEPSAVGATRPNESPVSSPSANLLAAARDEKSGDAFGVMLLAAVCLLPMYLQFLSLIGSGKSGK